MTRKKNPHWARVRRALVLSACLFAVSSAQAALDFNPLATASFINNTNVFSRPGDEPPFANTGNTALGDTIARYLAAATADYSWGLDRLRLNAQGERFDYNRFDALTHYESKFGGSFEWYLGHVLDGTLSYTQSRTMVPLADTLAEQLEIQNDKVAAATVRIRLTPQWRLDLSPTWHEFDSPLPGFADFGDRETGGIASINYVGIQKLTAGLRYQYVDGAYHGIVGATRYHQNTAELTADYAVSGFSTFNGQVGYTTRTNSLRNPADAGAAGALGGIVGDTNALTGELGFRRQLSVKTSVGLRIFRRVDSYIAGANSEIGTGGEANISWQPDIRFTVTARYRMATDSIQGTLAIADFDNRTDHSRNGELDLEYHAMRWLTLRPYVLRDQRTSNFHDANYHATIVGIDLTAHLK